MRRVALALCALALSSCGGITVPDPFAPSGAITLTGNPLKDFSPVTTKLASLTSSDLQTALADANATGDSAGAACWTLLLKDINFLNNSSSGGIATLAQFGRDIQVEIPHILNQCSGVVPMLSLP
jgi:hypothetical protein